MSIPYAPTSWNPTSGCSKVSPGCAHCWSEAVSHRFSMTHLPWTPEHAAENVALHPARLEEPLRWRKPRTVAVCFMGDLFHEQVPDEFISWVFAVAAMSPHHRFLLLTKRAERMHQYLTEMGSNPDAYVWAWAHEASNVFLDGALAPAPLEVWPLPNVWLGVTAENQRMADERIPLLLDTPGKHWVSLEPLLGPVDLTPWMFALIQGPEERAYVSRDMALDAGDPSLEGSVYASQQQEQIEPIPPGYPRLDWVVVGGESGPGHRRMDLQWAADIYAQCHAANVAVYFKQIAASHPGRPSGVAVLDGAKETPWTR